VGEFCRLEFARCRLNGDLLRNGKVNSYIAEKIKNMATTMSEPKERLGYELVTTKRNTKVYLRGP